MASLASSGVFLISTIIEGLDSYAFHTEIKSAINEIIHVIISVKKDSFESSSTLIYEGVIIATS
jgi:hypothetical protein